MSAYLVSADPEGVQLIWKFGVKLLPKLVLDENRGPTPVFLGTVPPSSVAPNQRLPGSTSAQFPFAKVVH